MIDFKRHEEWVILDRLADIILKNVEGCVVEIGMGSSTYILADHARAAGVKMYACDSKGNKARSIAEKIGYENLIIYQGKSVHFIEEFDDTPALVFLDGCHSYKTVGTEARFFLDKLVPGGVMFLHDTYIDTDYYRGYEARGKAHRYDTYKIRQELELVKDAWCLTFPYTAARCGLTMVLKKEANPPFYRL